MQRVLSSAGWVVAGALALLVAASLADAVSGGDLDPPGPLGPTMRAIDDLPQPWDRILTSDATCSSPRFECVLDTRGVLDRETGLVWRSNGLHFLGEDTWLGAVQNCWGTPISDRLGWRLPSIHELATLVDPTVAPAFPPSSPFFNVQADQYWSSTFFPGSSTLAMVVDFGNGQITSLSTTLTADVLCVRGPES